MKSIHNLIYSKTKERWIVVSEKVKGNGKVPKSLLCSIAAIAAMLSAGEPVYGLSPGAMPTGGQITAGRGTIATSGNQMTVNQSSKQLIANWQTFNIGQNASVSFNQPSISSTALNRITDQSPSQIMGSLSSNGQVFLLNPSGIIFGKTAQVNVGGLVASSLNMLNSDFLAGKYTFSNTGTVGSIQNQGTINASNGGVVALIAPKVANEGSISANNGSVLLAAGRQVMLDFAGDGLISYTVDQGAIDALAENDGLIKADGGQVVMTAKAADALRTATVTNTGVIEARTLQNKAGRILLLSDMQNGKTNFSGTLDASAPNGGDGGFIETSAAHVQIADGSIVTTLAPQGKAGTWLIDPTDFTISSGTAAQTISGIGATTLSTALGTNNVAIATSTTQTGTNLGDINVNAPVSWSANTLTLTAANNININAVMTAGASSSSTSAGLAMNTGTAKNIITGLNADGSFKGQVNFFNADGTTPRSGTGFLTINSKPYTVISSLTQLQNMNANLSGCYALGSNVNASATASSNFIPIGNSVLYSIEFTGIFDGLGHTINNLTVNNLSNKKSGLFASIGLGSVIRNVGLVNPSVTGTSFVGTLVGWNDVGMVSNSSVSGGSVSSTGGCVGGLVGLNSGTINGSSNSSCLVSGIGQGSGGLVGSNSGTISGSSVSSCTVRPNQVFDVVGGLVGINIGTIKNCSTTSISVGGGYYVGGLVGYNLGAGTISNSYASGNVSGNIFVGGLVGESDSGSITNSYATGNVLGTSYVGGLLGYNRGIISNSYASGNVSGSSSAGGLVGYNGGTISNSFWNITTSGKSTSSGGIGKTNAQMMQLSTFSSWNTSTPNTIANTGGNGSVWRIYEGQTEPLLTFFLKPLTLADAPDVTTTYNGSSQSANSTTTTIPLVLGSAATGTNAGFYNGYYSTQQGYDIIGGNLTITPKALNMSGLSVAASKVYDGTTKAVVTGSKTLAAETAGQGNASDGKSYSGDSVSITGTAVGTYNSKDVATASSVTYCGLSLTGSQAGNYTLTIQSPASAKITPKTVTLSATKTYDGTTTLGAGTVTIGTGVTVNGITELLGYSGGTAFSKNIADNTINYINAITLLNGTGGLVSNYALPNLNHSNAPVTIR